MNCSRSLDNVYEHLRIIKMKMRKKGNKCEMVVILVKFKVIAKKEGVPIWENQLYYLCAKIITRYINAMTVKRTPKVIS